MFGKVTLTVCLLSFTNAVYTGPLADGEPASLYPAGVDPRSCPNFPVCTNPAVAATQTFQPRKPSSPFYNLQDLQPQRPQYHLQRSVTPVIVPQRYPEPEFKFVPKSASAQQFTPVTRYTPLQNYVQRQTQPQYTPPQSYVQPQMQPRVSPLQNYVLPQSQRQTETFLQAQPQYQPQPQPQAQGYAVPQQYARLSNNQQYTPEQQRALNKGEYIGDGDYHGEGLAESLAPEYQGQQQSYQPVIPSTQYNTPAYQKVSAFLAQSQNVRQTPTNGCRNRAYC